MYKDCKSKHAKERQLKIMLSFVELLEKNPLDTITVTSLCAYAQIPRKAFYRYFDTISDLIDFWTDQIIRDMRDVLSIIDFSNKAHLRSYLEDFFKYWNQHRSTIHIIRKNQLSNHVFMRMTNSAAKDFSAMNLNTSQISQEEIRFQMFVLIPALISILYLWDDEHYSYSVKDITDITYQTLSKPLL
ncbi:MAG: TetR/AcrR family transcriptional regulator [Solobacterium sp.]|nr:TetR/AcrR family transcriptional regulator [Solobacterium sp.]